MLSLYVFVYECVRVRVCPPARVFVEQVAQAGPASMTKYIEVVLALGIQVQICDYTSARSRFFWSGFVSASTHTLFFGEGVSTRAAMTN